MPASATTWNPSSSWRTRARRSARTTICLTRSSTTTPSTNLHCVGKSPHCRPAWRTRASESRASPWPNASTPPSKSHRRPFLWVIPPPYPSSKTQTTAPINSSPYGRISSCWPPHSRSTTSAAPPPSTHSSPSSSSPPSTVPSFPSNYGDPPTPPGHSSPSSSPASSPPSQPSPHQSPPSSPPLS